MPDASLIRDFGPIVILLYMLPSMINRVMGVIDASQQSRAAVARAPYEALNTVLSQNTQRDLIAIEMIGLRAAVDRANAAIEEIKQELRAFIESHKESK